MLVGIGSTMYLTANLGPGPRDGWMTGLQRATGVPIGRVRITIEATVLVIGIVLGGNFGIGSSNLWPKLSDLRAHTLQRPKSQQQGKRFVQIFLILPCGRHLEQQAS